MINVSELNSKLPEIQLPNKNESRNINATQSIYKTDDNVSHLFLSLDNYINNESSKKKKENIKFKGMNQMLKHKYLSQIRQSQNKSNSK